MLGLRADASFAWRRPVGGGRSWAAGPFPVTQDRRRPGGLRLRQSRRG